MADQTRGPCFFYLTFSPDIQKKANNREQPVCKIGFITDIIKEHGSSLCTHKVYKIYKGFLNNIDREGTMSAVQHTLNG